MQYRSVHLSIIAGVLLLLAALYYFRRAAACRRLGKPYTTAGGKAFVALVLAALCFLLALFCLARQMESSAAL